MNESVLTGPVHFGDNVCTKVKVVRGGEFISRKKKEEKKKIATSQALLLHLDTSK